MFWTGYAWARWINLHKDDVNAIARHQPARIVWGILERRMVRGEHDVAQQRQLRMHGGRPVHRGDHRCLDLEQVHQQALGVG